MNGQDKKRDALRLQYAIIHDRYKRLGHNLAEAIESFLNQEGISYISVNHRIKKLESFLEKQERKAYNDPFSQMEDICGIRIICYFQSDIEKIKKILKKEFKVINSFDKEKYLNPMEFGYRSSHFVVKIKNEWLHAPNYRDLKNLKAEIQVRTVLMHAWAEIEHKLAYKKQEHIPPQFRRKFSRVSAKLEEADEQFEDLMRGIYNHKQCMIQEARKKKGFNKSSDMNLDSLQAFLDFHFPKSNKSIKNTRNLLDEFLRLKISMRDLVKSFERIKKYLPSSEGQLIKGLKEQIEQTNVLKSLFDITPTPQDDKSRLIISSINKSKKSKINQ